MSISRHHTDLKSLNVHGSVEEWKSFEKKTSNFIKIARVKMIHWNNFIDSFQLDRFAEPQKKLQRICVMDNKLSFSGLKKLTLIKRNDVTE